MEDEFEKRRLARLGGEDHDGDDLDDEDLGDEFNFIPDAKAEVVEVAGGLAWLRFRSEATGEVEKKTLGEHDPWPVDNVQAWATTWNERGVARWPDAWIIVQPTKPITAAAMCQDAKGYGPTLEVMIRVGPDVWRVYAPSKDQLLNELTKLPLDAPAEIPLPGGYMYRCFGSTLGTFAPIGDGLFKVVDAGEYASVALYGETVDPA